MTGKGNEMLSELEAAVSGPVIAIGDDDYDANAIGHNTAIVPVADLIVGARSANDVAAALRYAASDGLRVAVFSTGHGPVPPPAQILINTSRMNEVDVDPGSSTATVGGGVRWAQVVTAAAEHGLAPITGSSTSVGVAGYLLGGGIGPLVRSHGFSSDYAESFEVVTGDGEIRIASADENADLFWALRGGKQGLGVVTSLKVRLVELSTLYAGSLTFDEADIERALRGWIEWLPQSDLRVTTSFAITQFPAAEQVPPELRGRRLLSIRFAFPGSAAEGEKLAAPLRELAPVYIDGLGEIAATEISQINNDPTDAGPSWTGARLLGEIDDGFATRMLAFAGAGTMPPFVSVEVRRLGGAAAVDVAGGSAASGRGALHTLSMVGVDPTQFATRLGAAAGRFYETIRPYLSAEGNPNFAASPTSLTEFEAAFDPATRERLRSVRRAYDPDGVIALWG